MAKVITIMEFRKGPGYFMFRVQHDHESFIITERGKPVARLVPFEEGTIILADGAIKGEKPLTMGQPELLGGSY